MEKKIEIKYDNGYFYCPYIPGEFSESGEVVFDETCFGEVGMSEAPAMVMTRFHKTKAKEGYGKISVDESPNQAYDRAMTVIEYAMRLVT